MTDRSKSIFGNPVSARGYIKAELPLIGTHVCPAQAALHSGMRNVVNAIPDNRPIALPLAEGSVHTIQTRRSYMGYHRLNGMQGKDMLSRQGKCWRVNFAITSGFFAKLW